MKKKMTMMFLIFFGISNANAGMNSAYLELLGNGGLYSVNYERFLNEDLYGIRAGFSTISSSENGDTTSVYTAPIMFVKLFGKDSNYLEVGFGRTFVSASVHNDSLNLKGDGGIWTGCFGYRYQSEAQGALFKIGLTPFIAEGNFIPSIGLGFGYTF